MLRKSVWKIGGNQFGKLEEIHLENLEEIHMKFFAEIRLENFAEIHLKFFAEIHVVTNTITTTPQIQISQPNKFDSVRNALCKHGACTGRAWSVHGACMEHKWGVH